jgi:probable HAF family extracellular repeat protein
MALVHCLRFCCVLIALGLIVGLAGDANAQSTYSFTTLDVPGASFPGPIVATGINDSGQIVGYYPAADGTYHGFLLSDGNYTTLDVPGWSDTFASGINDSGQIVGYYGDSNVYYAYPSHGFLLDQGSYTTLNAPESLLYTKAMGSTTWARS